MSVTESPPEQVQILADTVKGLVVKRTVGKAWSSAAISLQCAEQLLLSNNPEAASGQTPVASEQIDPPCL